MSDEWAELVREAMAEDIEALRAEMGAIRKRVDAIPISGLVLIEDAPQAALAFLEDLAKRLRAELEDKQ